MPTTLLIVYRVLGTVLFALAAAAIVEKYRTVRGAALLPARVLECRRACRSGTTPTPAVWSAKAGRRNFLRRCWP